MRSVLVTGSTGFIGKQTVIALEKADWHVTTAVRHEVPSQGQEALRIDLESPDSILALGKKRRFDAVVHLGAHVGWSGATIGEMYTPNVLATACIAKLAREWGSHVVYASAAVVCGARTGCIANDTPVKADTPYAHTKLLGEQLIEASQVESCILRIGGVFGLNGPSHLSFNRAIQGVVEGKLPLQDGAGSETTSMLRTWPSRSLML